MNRVFLTLTLLAGLFMTSGVTLAVEDEDLRTIQKTDASENKLEKPSWLENAGDDDKNLLPRLMWSISLVIVLGGIALYLSKKVLPGFTGTQGSKLKVAGSVSLGPRRSACILEVEGRGSYLVASTPEKVTLLADLSIPTGLNYQEIQKQFEDKIESNDA